MNLSIQLRSVRARVVVNLLQHTIPRQWTRRDLSKYDPIDSIKSVRARVIVNLLQHTIPRQQTRRDLSKYEIYRFNEGQCVCGLLFITFYNTLYDASGQVKLYFNHFDS